MSEYVLNSKYELLNEVNYENVCQYLLEYLAIHKEDDLIIDYKNNISFNGQRINDLSHVIANALLNEYKLKCGEIVCFICPNHYFQAIGFISVLSAGGVCLFVNEKSTYDELKNIFNKININYLFCGKRNETIAAKLIQNFSEIKNVFIVAEDSYESENNFLNIKHLLSYETNKNNKIPVERTGTDLALIELTKGTNDGIRRPVAKTHSNLIHSIQQMQNNDILANNKEDLIISIAFDKLFGISFFMNSLISGSKFVIISGAFDTDSTYYLDSIERLKVSKLILYSYDIKLMIKNEINLLSDISSIKEILHIGVFDDYNDLRQRVENMFKCRYFRGVYGTVESGIISCLYRSKAYERNGYSVGQLIPGNQLKVVDIRSGESLPAHQIGEICVKSKQLSPGYVLSAKSEMKSLNMTDEGYLKTNDAGYYDNEGNVYIESKVSDIICIEDQILRPNELEILLLSHPNVIDACVIGIYCRDIDEDLDTSSDKTNEINNSFKIFVVLRVGADTSDLDLINFINERVEPIRQIDSRIFIVDVLPRNSTGIINRSALIKY